MENPTGTSSAEAVILALVEQETGKPATVETFVADLASLEVMEVLLGAENHFGTKLPNDAFKHIRTVGDIVRLFTAATPEDAPLPN